jgi:hypothetical protein
MGLRRGGRILWGGVVVTLSTSIISAGEWHPLRRLLNPGAAVASASPEEASPRSLPAAPAPTPCPATSASSHCGTNFGVQAFPYGYFGAKSGAQAVYHQSYHDEWSRSYHGQWDQWTIVPGN